jgi:hypothetical protein
MALREVFARFTTQFNGSALTRGNAQVQGLTSNLNGAVGKLQGLGAAFAGLAIVAVIRSWISAASEFVSSMAAIGDELDKTSRALGIGADSLQAWQHAAGLSGVESSAFNGALRRLGANMSAAVITPTSAAAIEFRRLGISLRDGDGQLRDMTDVMLDMADPIAGMASGTQRVATLTALMGRQGAALGPMFEGGREGVEAMRAELERLGGGASQDMIQAAADWTDANARLDLSLLSIKSRIATGLLPVLEGITNAVTAVTSWFARNRTAALLLEVAAVGVAAAFAFLAVVVLIILSPILILLGTIFAVVVIAVLAVILVIEDLYQWFAGGESVIGSFVEALLALAGISLADVRAEITSVFDTLRNGYNTIASTIGLPMIGQAEGGHVVDTSRAGPKAEGSAAPRAAPLGAGQEFLQNLRAAGHSARVDPAEVRAGLRREGGGAAGARPTQTVNQRTEISIAGVTDPAEIEARVRRVIDAGNREAVEALGQ